MGNRPFCLLSNILNEKSELMRKERARTGVGKIGGRKKEKRKLFTNQSAWNNKSSKLDRKSNKGCISPLGLNSSDLSAATDEEQRRKKTHFNGNRRVRPTFYEWSGWDINSFLLLLSRLRRSKFTIIRYYFLLPPDKAKYITLTRCYALSKIYSSLRTCIFFIFTISDLFRRLIIFYELRLTRGWP